MKKYKLTLICGILLLFCGILLGLAAKGAGPLTGDLPVGRLIQRALPFNKSVASVWSAVGYIVQYLPYAVIVILLLMRRWEAAVLTAAATLPIIFFGEAQLKTLFARPRPGADLITIYQAARGMSFPSGTAMQTMSVVGVVVYLALSSYQRRPDSLPRLISSAAMLLLLISNFARLHVGAHWASDILGGWLLSGGWVMLLVSVYQRRIERRSKAIHF